MNYPVNQLLNVTHRQQWIQKQVSQVYEYFYDGVNFDTEDALPLTRRDLREALTSLVNETYQILKAKNKNYQVSFMIFLSSFFARQVFANTQFSLTLFLKKLDSFPVHHIKIHILPRYFLSTDFNRIWRSGERGSGISVLAARHDDNDSSITEF